MGIKKDLDFKLAAIKKNHKKWVIYDCSICSYPCGYIFDDHFERVRYDSGCYCTNNRRLIERDWSSVSRHYNMQTSEEVIKKMNAFWGFMDEIRKDQ